MKKVEKGFYILSNDEVIDIKNSIDDFNREIDSYHKKFNLNIVAINVLKEYMKNIESHLTK